MAAAPPDLRVLPLAAGEALEAFVVALVADRLREERSLAEQRHSSLCEALRRDLDAISSRVMTAGCERGPGSENNEEPVMGELLKMSAPLPSLGGLPAEDAGEVDVEDPRWDQVEVLIDTAIDEAAEAVVLGKALHSNPPQCIPQEGLLDAFPLTLDNVRISTGSADVVFDLVPSGKTSRPDMKHLPTSSKLLSGPEVCREGRPWLERFVMGSTFELFFGFLILANAAIMALEVQYDGMRVEKVIGFMNSSLDTPVDGWPNAELSFVVLDWVFGLSFASEVFLKTIVMRGGFFLSLWNYFDTIIVGIWFVSSLATFGFAMDPLVLRLFRFARLLRLVRLMKMTSWFDTLVLMVSSIQASVFVLLWGVVLLILVMTMCSLMLNSFLMSFMLDDDEPEVIRHEVFMYLGTYSRCMVTMFEITLGNWVPLCRLLGDHVNEGLAIFFLVYRCVVGFAVMNVIKGVFLHETFRCAGLDDDLMVLHRRRMRAKFKDKMMQFFTEADTGNDGEITVDEFCAMIDDDRVNTWLEAMDLRVRDVGAERVFAFLAGGDMILSRAELCTGMSRLRGAAQGLDVISLLGLTAPDIAVQLPVPADVLRLRNDLPRHSQYTFLPLPEQELCKENLLPEPPRAKTPPEDMSFFPV